jgi:hypothetical protein
VNDVTLRRRTVRLVDVPVDLYRRAHQHTDDLLRELVLIAENDLAGGRDGAVVKLARRADDHRATRLRLRRAAAPAVQRARERGDAAVTLTYEVDDNAITSSAEWSALLDELDALCRSGELLTVPAQPDVALLSRWMCEEFVHQLRDGQPPCPWPHYLRSQRVSS